MEQVALGGAVALADDQLEPAAGEVVEGGVVLERADRVQQRQRRDRGEQPDVRGPGGDVAQYHGRGGGNERPFVPLPDPETVEAEFLGQTRVADHFPEPLLGGFLLARVRVRGVHDQRDGDEPHEAARVVVVSPARLSGARPRWSRSVVPV